MTLLALGNDSELVVQGGEFDEPCQDQLLLLDRSVGGCNVGGQNQLLLLDRGLVDIRMRRFHKRHGILQAYPECSY